MTVLVIGGAGYIGSHTVRQLVEAGERVLVLDNLRTGHRAAVHPSAVFIEGAIQDGAKLQEIFTSEPIETVMHFAASSLVGESVEKPLDYFRNNVYGMQVLLEEMVKADVKQLIFSSTAATYGEVEQMPITEETPQKPTNPYGESKFMMEAMVKWSEVAYGLKYVSLRYFNVAGADLSGEIGEDHSPETHLVPIILEAALGQRPELTIFGEDYDTPDGSCIRDYVHVVDLAKAHLLARDYLNQGGASDAFNLGSNQGFSVKEMVAYAEKVTGKTIPVRVSDRRAGDPAVLVASPKKAEAVLGWQKKYTNLDAIFETAYEWHATHPEGYQD